MPMFGNIWSSRNGTQKSGAFQRWLSTCRYRFYMSDCVVAEYPWKRIRGITDLGASGAIVCTDTRLTLDGKPHSILIAKQRSSGKNLIVCYTSSELRVTTTAINEAL